MYESLWLLPRASSLLTNQGVLPLHALHASLPLHSQVWSLNSACGGLIWQIVLLLALLASTHRIQKLLPVHLSVTSLCRLCCLPSQGMSWGAI